MKASELPVPKEADEQIMLFRWAEWQDGKYPELKLLYHVPNGGTRNRIEAARLKLQGVKTGVPDIVLPVARGGYHGLYVELKRQRGGRTSESQKEWIGNLNQQGYCAIVCKGFEEASKAIIKYLEGMQL